MGKLAVLGISRMRTPTASPADLPSTQRVVKMVWASTAAEAARAKARVESFMLQFEDMCCEWSMCTDDLET